jgi:hypothetical protein
MTPDSKRGPARVSGTSSVVQFSQPGQSEDSTPPHRPQPGRYAGGPGHKGPSDTSCASAKAFAHKAIPIRARALAEIRRGPATVDTVANEIGEHFMIVRARCSELRSRGLIEDSGQRGRGALGGKVVVWRSTTPLERAIFNASKAMETEKTGGEL